MFLCTLCEFRELDQIKPLFPPNTSLGIKVHLRPLVATSTPSIPKTPVETSPCHVLDHFLHLRKQGFSVKRACWCFSCFHVT